MRAQRPRSYIFRASHLNAAAVLDFPNPRGKMRVAIRAVHLELLSLHVIVSPHAAHDFARRNCE
jgi:hypothetical protein